MIAGARGARHGKLAVGVKELVGAGRAYEDRRIISGAEQLDAGIDLRDVVETARHELEFEKILAVGAQRYFVVDAGCHVAEMRRRHVPAGDRFELKHVDRILGPADQFAATRRRPHHGIG